MQFPYPTAALIATPLRTTYLSLLTAIVPPAMPIILLAMLFIQLTMQIIQLSAPTVPPSIPSALLRAPTLPLAVIIVLLRAPTIPPSTPSVPLSAPSLPVVMTSTLIERTNRTSHYDISTTTHTNHPRRCAPHPAAHIIPHACRAHHSAAHLFNLVSAFYFH